MSLFGDLDVRLDPWDVDYGTELPLEAEDVPTEAVVLDVEVPAGEWKPVIPPRIVWPRLVFVDGVRRIEARLVVRRADRRSEEHTSELQSRSDLVCRLLLEKKKYDA